MALAHPESVIGIHVTDLGFYTLNARQPDLTPAEKQYVGANQGWFFQEGAYAMLHASKPQTLAYGLNDSPVGLAAWMVEKFRAWSDCNGEVETRFSKDELLTHVMIYWVTQTINSSIRSYYKDLAMPQPLSPGQHIEVPAGFARFPKDLPPGVNLPRELVERHLRVTSFTQMPRGGHFAALEEPELLVEDMRAGRVEMLLILGGNPAFTAAADLDFANLLLAVSRKSETLTGFFVTRHGRSTAVSP